MNLRCLTLTDFKWYKDVFLSRVFQLNECHNAIWKEKFVSGLSPLFAEKVRESIRQHYNNALPYDQISYGELTQKINQTGLALCNDLKLKGQLKKQRLLGWKELGDFCYQFGVENPKLTLRNSRGYREKINQKKDKKEKRKYQKNQVKRFKNKSKTKIM